MSWTLIASLISLAGLTYMMQTDPKRRRTHGQSKLETRPYLNLARGLTFGPGILLMLVGNWSGLSIWGGIVTVLGWVMSALTPSHYEAARIAGSARLAQWVNVAKQKSQGIFHVAGIVTKALWSSATAVGQTLKQRAKTPQARNTNALESRIEELENRIRSLEVQLKNQAAENSAQPEKPDDVDETVVPLKPAARSGGE